MNPQRILYFTLILIGTALPVWANNPPRPDGVLYVILIFPLLAIAGKLAGVVPEERSALSRVLRGLGFALLILMSAAGTELGFLAVFILVLYGLIRSLRILTGGSGAKSIVWATVACLGTLAAGAGYFWAATTMNVYMAKKSRQQRTMADIRTLSTGFASWSIDQLADAAPTEQASTTTSSPAPEVVPETISFANQDPPPITTESIEELLVPNYLRVVPDTDAWDRPLDIRFDPETHRLQIRSSGADGKFEGEVYHQGPFARDEFERDIVFADGLFIAWPESVRHPQ